MLSREDKTAVVAIVQAGEFFGEGCLAGQKVRISTATTIGPCAITRIEKQSMQRHLQRDPAFSAKFVRHLLARNIRIEEDLVDQIFNSTEKRLARVLLLLANFGKEKKPDRTVPRVSQTILAEIVGTTRTRINILMNRFRKLGFIDYNGGLQVHSTLLKVILHD